MYRGLFEDYFENIIIVYWYVFMLYIDMLEIDVYYIKDKEFVVIYDDIIDCMLNGKGKVFDFILKELKVLDFGFYKGEKFKGESILIFDEVLDLVDNFL